MNKKPHKILNIKSDISQIYLVERFINELFTEFKLPKKYFNKTLLCVSEAVVNSINHGNKNNKEKRVLISVKCAINSLKIKVHDEGNGFNMDIIEDPTKKENLKKESGRGIHIIKALSDEVRYNNEQKCLELKIVCSE